MDARGVAGRGAHTRRLSEAGFHHFPQLGAGPRPPARRALFGGRGEAGGAAPRLAGRAPRGRASSLGRADAERAARGGPGAAERGGCPCREEALCTGCPAGRAFCEREGSECQAARLLPRFKRKRKGGGDRGEKGETQKGLTCGATPAAASCGCPSFLLLLPGPRRLPSGKAPPTPHAPRWGWIASCGVASGCAPRNPRVISPCCPASAEAQPRCTLIRRLRAEKLPQVPN